MSTQQSLAVTIIEAITGKHPYPLTGGLYNIMKAIMEMPQPQLPTSVPTSLNLDDFIKRCLNAPARDATTAETLLQHPFILSAIERGVISLDEPVVLSPPPRPIRMEVNIPSSYTLIISTNRILQPFTPTLYSNPLLQS